MNLHEHYKNNGATLAPDGIPLDFGDQQREYRAALENVVLMDRSHEGRIELTGRDRSDVLHRISTNDLLNMAAGEGRATIFTNHNGRILDRAVIYNRPDERTLAIAGPGRGPALMAYLQRNIFFNDQVKLADLTPDTRQFALHGPQADAVVESLLPGTTQLPAMHSAEAEIGGESVFIARRKPLSGTHWSLNVPNENALDIWQALVEAGQAHGLLLAGALTYTILRVQAGQSAAGRELSADFIPLEAGLWDEVSFTKGCYTGQEIIARMESRGRLAKLMVRLTLDSAVETPADLAVDGRSVGTLTSAATTPDGEHVGIGFVKPDFAHAGQRLVAGEAQVAATVRDLAGVFPEAHVSAGE